MVNISKFSGLASKTLKFLKPSTRKVVIGLGSIYGATVMIGAYLGDKEHREKIENYKYVPPKIGEDGIVKADTLNFLDGSKCIDYRNEDNQLVQSTNYDNNGKMERFDRYEYESPISEDWDHAMRFDRNGELFYDETKHCDGSSYIRFKSGGYWYDIYPDSFLENK